ncbi:MAG: hypothetical protein L3K19_04040 [Thermoplasmata archaeon]|nr:hypothetical protein [Thermoplasmata archaeon]
MALIALVVLSGSAGGSVLLPGTAVHLPPYRVVVTGAVPVHAAVGCAGSTGGPMRWDRTLGTVSAIDFAKAAVCVKSFVGGSSTNFAHWSNSLQLSFPLVVHSNGNHSIALQWTVSLSSMSHIATGNCPPANINYRIGVGNSSSGSCESGADLGFYLWATVEDPNGSGGFVGNISDAGNDNFSYWVNDTSCSNAGTLACSNSTYGYQYLLCYGTNEVGSISSGLSGSHTITMWTNGSGMLKSHQFKLVVGFTVYAGAYSTMTNLLRMWKAAATAAVDMRTFGNGATLNSITVS